MRWESADSVAGRVAGRMALAVGVAGEGSRLTGRWGWRLGRRGESGYVKGGRVGGWGVVRVGGVWERRRWGPGYAAFYWSAG